MSHYFHTSLLLLWCSVVCAVADHTSLRGNAASRIRNHQIQTQLLSSDAEPSNGAQAKSKLGSGLWSTPRVSTFRNTVEDNTKHCHYYNYYYSDMSDLRGGGAPCRYSTGLDYSSGNTLYWKKMNHLVGVSFPEFAADLRKHFLVKRILNVTPVDMSNVPICREFVRPSDHATKGVPETDIVIYTSANPFPDNYPSNRLWVHACQVKKDQPIVLAVNFNPEYIIQGGNEKYSLEQIYKAFNIKPCQEGGKALIWASGEFDEMHFHGKCVKVNCDETNEEDKVKQWKDGQWTPCPSNPLKLPNYDPAFAECPPPSEFCEKEHAL